ncbi:formate dehydrogenase accessory sulfurtransferase FdhD [Oryzibacter oryziterrae]|uniref:formate dehydrogenase accessory sulfurtransferase FdhD n=1 Tax=Oryzibacter oryziterrae TaxID=2766474 RepID=UPI001F02E532|nr:formate dehydrogenase accessory sulfurtransferase FdhD [Oryzibacter oryziterrae]
MPSPLHHPLLIKPGTAPSSKARRLPEEMAVAMVHNGSTTAVLMASPCDLEDLAIGFAITEGLIEAVSEVRDVEIVEGFHGIEARLWLPDERAAALSARRRAMVGPTGCGLCGVESLEAAVRLPRAITRDLSVGADAIRTALQAVRPLQRLGSETQATHAAAFASVSGEVLLVREDVGRHNALDKLVGAVLRQGLDPKNGFVLVTSRVSVEMVQKAAALGSAVLVAVSAPTDLAIRVAHTAGLTVIAVARQDSFEIFTHADRIVYAEEPV